MSIKSYFKCKHCLYAQDLDTEMFDGVFLGIPEEDKGNYIDCHLALCQPPNEKRPEFNLKHRESVGCLQWACSFCGGDTPIGHASCYK